jgi:hypothetical protein
MGEGSMVGVNDKKAGKEPPEMRAKTDDADRERCQARIRCRNTPTLIAIERELSSDGRPRGRISLCADCYAALKQELGPEFVTKKIARKKP